MPEVTYAFIYRIQMQGSIFGQQCINNFYYGSGTEPTTLDALNLDFQTNVWRHLQPMISDSYVLHEVAVQGVKGDLSFGSVAYEESGTVGGDCLPGFVSWDFTILRAGLGERNGYKRFAGVPESLQNDGNPTAGALATAIAAATYMASTISTGALLFDPVIQRDYVHKIKQNPPKYYSYSAVVFSRIGSQNSRKVGHGR